MTRRSIPKARVRAKLPQEVRFGRGWARGGFQQLVLGSCGRRYWVGNLQCARKEGNERWFGENEVQKSSFEGSADSLALDQPLLGLLGEESLSQLNESELTDLQKKLALC